MFEEHLLTVRKKTSTVRYMINTSKVLRKTAFAENVSTKLNAQEDTELLSNIKQNIPDIEDWRVYDHCVVTRLYAIYEGFIEILVTSWLELISKNIPCYLDLDERIRNTHQIGVGRLLLEQKKTRYENLDMCA